MFGKDVLNRFDQRRRFWRSIIITLIVSFDICFLLELTAFAILVKSGKFKFPTPTIKVSTSVRPSSERQSQNPAKSAEKIMPFALIQPQPFAQLPQSFAQPASTIPEANTERITHRVPPTDIPMPPARPSRLASTRKLEKSNDLNKAKERRSTKQDALVEQTDENKQPSNRPRLRDIDARRTAALDLERSYTNAGVAISAKISGPNGTILNLEYSRFNDAQVKNIMSVHAFAATLRNVGFTTITFTSGQNKKWVFPLAAPSQSDTPSQHSVSNKAGDGHPVPKLATDPLQHSDSNHVGVRQPLQLLR